MTGSLLFREVAAAHDWGIDLVRWFSFPSHARAMMIAYSEITSDISELLSRWKEQ